MQSRNKLLPLISAAVVGLLLPCLAGVATAQDDSRELRVIDRAGLGGRMFTHERL